MLKKIITTAAAALLASAGLAFVTPATASAEETPTARELLDKCDNGTDVCMFHPAGPPEEYTGGGHQVGEAAFNCTQDLQRSTVNWSDTTSESNSFGVSLSAEVGFSEVFKVSIETSYQHTWESSHTEGQATNVDVRPGEKGWVERAPKMQKVTGQYEMHFGDPYYGHYIWYLDFTADGPMPGSTGDIVQKTAAMTDQEKTEHWRLTTAPVPAGVPNGAPAGIASCGVSAVVEVMREARVAAPVDAVWAVVSDAGRAADWFEFAQRTEVVDGEGVGQKRTQYGTWGRKSSEVDQEVTEFEPGKVLAWRHVAERLDGKPAPKFAVSTEFRIELTAAGEATGVRLRSLQEPDGAVKGWLMKRLGAKDVERNLDRSLERLDALFARQ